MNTALSLLSVTSLISSLSGLSAIASSGRLTVAVQFGKGFRVELRKLVILSPKGAQIVEVQNRPVIRPKETLPCLSECRKS
jgi:hypothetical protein